MLDDLDATFNVAELKELCLRLKVDYESLGGGSRRLKMQELILYLKRRDREMELVQALVKARLHLANKYGLPPALVRAEILGILMRRRVAAADGQAGLRHGEPDLSPIKEQMRV